MRAVALPRPPLVTAVTALIVVASAAASPAAHASATVDCTADDRTLAFALTGTVGSFGEAIAPHRIELDVKPQSGRAARHFTAEGDGDDALRLTQQWLQGRELRLFVFSADAVAFTAETRRSGDAEEDVYRGRYKLALTTGASAPWIVTGRITCTIGH